MGRKKEVSFESAKCDSIMVNNKDGYKMNENCLTDKQGKGQIEGKVMLAKNSDEG